MERLVRFGALGGNMNIGGTPSDSNQVDTSETVYISSLALLKMLKHGRAGVPMEVMGLMLGEFVDEYTVNVIDVFAMPQSGTGVSVEAVDPVFQAKMLDMLKQTGRPEMVVGWYHSHPGFGCWLSGVDINTQQSFESLSDRAVAVVVDPIQSVKGKVVIDAFRTINPQAIALNQEPRQTTSNIGHLQKPSIQALIHGLNRHYYSIPIAYRTHNLEQKMLLNLNKQSWNESLALGDFQHHCNKNEKTAEEMLKLAKSYKKALEEEEKMTEEQLAIKNVGKLDPKRHLSETVNKIGLAKIDNKQLSQRFNLEDQVNHASEFVLEIVKPTMANKKLTIVGHSIGAYIGAAIKPYLERDGLTIDLIGLFPTFVKMAETPAGVKVRPYVDFFAKHEKLTRVSLWGLRWVPIELKRLIVRLFMRRSLTPSVNQAAAELIDSLVFRNVTFMASNELNVVHELQPKMQTELSTGNVHLYYGLNDHWAPITYAHEIAELIGKDRVTLDDTGAEHAFVLKDSFVIAKKVVEFLK
ncbi:26S proteasome regulatory subunit RPN11 [Aphelenchoides bicaudatus]|nr:26S proteasome regulatory subunit RPN11 [Aphelenchoides bicaudatus]